MATFHRKNGVGYFVINRKELLESYDNPRPVCDECLRPLTDEDDITLFPILNEAYCSQCANNAFNLIRRIDEHDQPIAERRERFYADLFGVELEAK